MEKKTTSDKKRLYFFCLQANKKYFWAGDRLREPRR